MARRLTKLNDAGVRAILTSEGVAAHLQSWGSRVGSRAGGAPVERVENAPGGGRLSPRARVRVYGDMRREADTGYLSAAIGGGRR